jgi:antitoxin component YwqK of YwqJK toxin-antitoxin module
MNPVTEFYDNGKMKSWRQTDGDIEYVAEWYPTGILSMRGRYRNGLKDGEFNRYYENGTHSTDQFYTDGQLTTEYSHIRTRETYHRNFYVVNI